MAVIKQHDFVEIEYTGTIKEDSSVFDTTDEKIAKEHGAFDKNADYSPAIICIGEHNVLKSLDEKMIGKVAGEEYTFDLSPEEAFGKKDAKLIQMIPSNKFRQQKIQPVPGLQLNIDGMFGIVRTVSGGRCYVDFNHPLAGKHVVYKVNIKRIVEDSKEKLNSLLKLHLQMKDANVELNDGTARIGTKAELPKEVQEEFKKIANHTVPEVKNIEFSKKA